jgi:hypothetical protein
LDAFDFTPAALVKRLSLAPPLDTEGQESRSLLSIAHIAFVTAADLVAWLVNAQ